MCQVNTITCCTIIVPYMCIMYFDHIQPQDFPPLTRLLIPFLFCTRSQLLSCLLNLTFKNKISLPFGSMSLRALAPNMEVKSLCLFHSSLLMRGLLAQVSWERTAWSGSSLLDDWHTPFKMVYKGPAFADLMSQQPCRLPLFQQPNRKVTQAPFGSCDPLLLPTSGTFLWNPVLQRK